MIWKDPESACQLTFRLDQKQIAVEETVECSYKHGMGAVFNGNYEKGGVSIDTNLVSQGVLTKSEDDLFRIVVGDDYNLYLANMTTYLEEENLGDFQARVVSGFIRGVAPYSGGIIMM